MVVGLVIACSLLLGVWFCLLRFCVFGLLMTCFVGAGGSSAWWCGVGGFGGLLGGFGGLIAYCVCCLWLVLLVCGLVWCFGWPVGCSAFAVAGACCCLWFGYCVLLWLGVWLWFGYCFKWFALCCTWIW